MRKKLIVLGLITAMTFSMVACGNDDKLNNETTSGKETTVATETKDDDISSNEDTTDKNDNAVDELSDEYLLSLPETAADKFRYEETEEGNIRIKGLKNNDDINEIIIIPSQIDGKDVTEIRYEAFKYDVVAAVVTGENVKVIGKGAFYGASIKKVLINGPVTEIKAETFLSTRSSFEEVVLPDTIETICTDAFCSAAMKSIVVPESIKTIEYSAFKQTHLETIYFEGGTGTIEGGAFSTFYSDELRVYIPDCSLVFESDSFDDVAVANKTAITIVTPAGSRAEDFFKASGVEVENN